MMHRFVLTLFASILALGMLAAPYSARAKDGEVARPTHLRPVQSKADCAKALSLLAVICGAGVTAGDLQLIWDQSGKPVDGYKVFRVDAGGHQLLGTTTATYYLVKKPREGYANLCFAVEAYVGKENSKDSSRYCYAPGATATTRSFTPSHTVTQVTWKTPPDITCSSSPQDALHASAFFQAADNIFGSSFTVFFPFLRNESTQQGRVGVAGVYAGNEAAVMRISADTGWKFEGFGPPIPFTCRSGLPSVATATIKALAGTAFDLKQLAKHKLYSATLTLKSSQTVSLVSRKAKLSKGGWCAIWVEAANREWWLSPLGNLTYNESRRVEVVTEPTAPIDVTSLVSAWASVKYANNYGFIIASTLPSSAVPLASNACVTKFSRPSLKVTYF